MMLDITKGFVREAEHFPFSCELCIPPQKMVGDEVSYDGITISGTYSVTDDTVLVEGNLKAMAHGHCSLCLAPTAQLIEIAFSELFRRDCNELEDESFQYEGKSIDLDKLATTLLVLETPIRFTCDGDHSTQASLLGDVPDNPQPEDDDTAEILTRPFQNLKDILAQKDKFD